MTSVIDEAIRLQHEYNTAMINLLRAQERMRRTRHRDYVEEQQQEEQPIVQQQEQVREPEQTREEQVREVGIDTTVTDVIYHTQAGTEFTREYLEGVLNELNTQRPSAPIVNDDLVNAWAMNFLAMRDNDQRQAQDIQLMEDLQFLLQGNPELLEDIINIELPPEANGIFSEYISTTREGHIF